MRYIVGARDLNEENLCYEKSFQVGRAESQFFSRFQSSLCLNSCKQYFQGNVNVTKMTPWVIGWLCVHICAQSLRAFVAKKEICIVYLSLLRKNEKKSHKGKQGSRKVTKMCLFSAPQVLTGVAAFYLAMKPSTR